MSETLFTSKDGKEFMHRPSSYDRIIINVEWFGYKKRITTNPQDIWLDVGAHIGAFSVRISPDVQEVWAIEADPENFRLLKGNLERNHVDNVQVIQAAAVGSAATGEVVSFYRSLGTNTGLHSLVVKRGRQKIDVLTLNFRSLLSLSTANKLKLDIEGGELDILNSLTEMDFGQLEEIIMEYHFSALHDHDHEKYWSVVAMLKKYYNHVEHLEAPKKHWTCLIHCKGRKSKD